MPRCRCRSKDHAPCCRSASALHGWNRNCPTMRRKNKARAATGCCRCTRKRYPNLQIDQRVWLTGRNCRACDARHQPAPAMVLTKSPSPRCKSAQRRGAGRGRLAWKGAASAIKISGGSEFGADRMRRIVQRRKISLNAGECVVRVPVIARQGAGIGRDNRRGNSCDDKVTRHAPTGLAGLVISGKREMFLRVRD